VRDTAEYLRITWIVRSSTLSTPSNAAIIQVNYFSTDCLEIGSLTRPIMFWLDLRKGGTIPVDSVEFGITMETCDCCNCRVIRMVTWRIWFATDNVGWLEEV
jgi:hypothetical protein